MYGIELWGCASKSNIALIQRYQSKLLRTITKAPRYVSNHTLHSDLQVPYVHTVFRERTATHRAALDSHPNPLMEPLVHPPQALKKKMDIWRDTLRKRRWTPRSPPTWNSALAHRKLCSNVFWLLIKVIIKKIIIKKFSHNERTPIQISLQYLHWC